VTRRRRERPGGRRLRCGDGAWRDPTSRRREPGGRTAIRNGAVPSDHPAGRAADVSRPRARLRNGRSGSVPGKPVADSSQRPLPLTQEVVIRATPKTRKRRCSAVCEALCRTRTDDPSLPWQSGQGPTAAIERESLHTSRTGHCRRRQRSAPLGTLRYPPGTRPPAWFFGRPAASVLWVVAPRRRSRPAIRRHDLNQPRPRITTGRRGHGLVGLGGLGYFSRFSSPTTSSLPGQGGLRNQSNIMARLARRAPCCRPRVAAWRQRGASPPVGRRASSTTPSGC
jgi:hypothetical protein